jgi:zinc transporter, ZIP family
MMVTTVFLAALATALATGLGALPLVFVRSAGDTVLGVASAVAAGVMLAASLGLVLEGVDRSWARAALGAALGGLFVVLTKRRLGDQQDIVVGRLSGEDARKAVLIVAVMTVHSAAEGIGVGAAFGGGDTLGLLITVAIAVHNIPEGLAISLVLVPRGASVRAAAWWSVFSSLPQPLLAVPAFLFVEEFGSLLPVGLGFAAGAMVWMTAAEVLPDAFAHARARVAVAAVTASFAVMAAFQVLLL